MKMLFHGRFFIAPSLLLILIVWLLWPSIYLAPHVVPVTVNGNSVPKATVPLFNAWTIWWNAEQLACGFANYWNAPIFHPESGSFAFSEPQPMTMIVAPLVWTTRSPVMAYHAYLIVSLWLNGIAMLLLLRELKLGWWLSIAGGIAAVLHPMVWDNLEVIQLVPLWGPTLTILFLRRISDSATSNSSTLGSVAVLSLVGAATAWTCIHHFLFFWITLFPGLLLFCPIRKSAGCERIRWLASMGMAMLGIGILVSPIYLPMRTILSEHQFERSEEVRSALSAKTSQWLTTPDRTVWKRLPLVDSTEKLEQSRALNPGWARTLFCFAAIYSAIRYRRHRRIVGFLATMTVTAIILSLGGNFQVMGVDPWSIMVRTLPSLDKVRSVYRFGYFAQLAILILSVLGVGLITDELRRYASNRSRFATWFANGFLVAAGVLVAFETPPPSLTLVGVPVPQVTSGWLEYVRRNLAGEPLLFLPMAEGYSEAAMETDARWMFASIPTGSPIVNGYSGFFPKSTQAVLERFSKRRLVLDDFEFLSSIGVNHIVIDTSRPDHPTIAAEHAERVFLDDRGFEVWRLR